MQLILNDDTQTSESPAKSPEKIGKTLHRKYGHVVETLADYACLTFQNLI